MNMKKNSCRKPPWFRMSFASGEDYKQVRSLQKDMTFSTVCEEARCPNLGVCWNKKHATFLLLGKKCTRQCRFCDVDHDSPPLPPDPLEPFIIAETVRKMELCYCVLTSVTRDDLKDGGAEHFARSVREIKKQVPGILTEVLIPDFKGDMASLQVLAESGADVIGHNLETTRQLHPGIRPQSDYDRSLCVLEQLAVFSLGIITKSSFMVGLGETDEDVTDMLRDLHSIGVSIVHIGQYAQPTSQHVPVERYVHPDQFQVYAEQGQKIGIPAVLAGPFVRSSFQAEETYKKAIENSE